MSFNIVKTTSNNKNYNLQDILYYTDIKKMYYCSKDNELIPLDCGIFIDEGNSKDNIELPVYNRVYAEYDTQKLYKYTQDNKFVQILTENEILTIQCKYNEYVIATLSNNGTGIAPLTAAVNVLSDVDGNDAETIINEIDKKVNRYCHEVRYVDILSDNQNTYNIPYPISNFDLETSSMIIMYNNIVLDSIDHYMIKDDTIVMTIDAINAFNFKKGTLLTFIFGYNRLIGLNQISKDDLTSDIIDELEINKSHLKDYNNPHKVTKEQVGLGKVENYEIASSEDAEKGIAFDKYMTPATCKILVQKLQSDAVIQYDSYKIKRTEFIHTHTGYSGDDGKKYYIPNDVYDPDTDTIEVFTSGLKLNKGYDYKLEGNYVTPLVCIDNGQALYNVIYRVIPNSANASTIRTTTTLNKAEIGSDNITFALDSTIYNANCQVDIYKNGIRLIEDVKRTGDTKYDDNSDFYLENSIVTLYNPVTSSDSVYYFVYNTKPSFDDFGLVIDNLDTGVNAGGAENALSANMGNRLKKVTMDFDMDYILHRRPNTIVSFRNFAKMENFCILTRHTSPSDTIYETLQLEDLSGETTDIVDYNARNAKDGEYWITVFDSTSGKCIASIVRLRSDSIEQVSIPGLTASFNYITIEKFYDENKGTSGLSAPKPKYVSKPSDNGGTITITAIAIEDTYNYSISRKYYTNDINDDKYYKLVKDMDSYGFIHRPFDFANFN